MMNQYGSGASSSSWNQFVSANKGSGKTMAQLGAEYRALKASGADLPLPVYGPRKQMAARKASPVRKSRSASPARATAPARMFPQYTTAAAMRARLAAMMQ